MGEMAGVVLPVPDVVDSGGGVYPQSPHSDRRGNLLALRGGAQRQPHSKFDSQPTRLFRRWRDARRRRHRESQAPRF